VFAALSAPSQYRQTRPRRALAAALTNAALRGQEAIPATADPVPRLEAVPASVTAGKAVHRALPAESVTLFTRLVRARHCDFLFPCGDY
jgi:hypothetical protein